MKPIVKFALLAICSCFFAGCGSSSPEDVAIDFMKALAKPDPKAAAELALPEVADRINEIAEAHPNATFKVLSSNATGEMGKVKVQVTENGDTHEVMVYLRKEDGDWKVEGTH